MNEQNLIESLGHVDDLKNFRHERFARFRSNGMLLEQAYERAGYVPNRSHASRLAARPEVRERIFNLRVSHTDIYVADLPEAIHTLMSMANQGWRTGTPEGIKEGRLALVEAVRLQEKLDAARNRDRETIFDEAYGQTERELSLESRRAPDGTLPAPRSLALPES